MFLLLLLLFNFKIYAIYWKSFDQKVPKNEKECEKKNFPFFFFGKKSTFLG